MIFAPLCLQYRFCRITFMFYNMIFVAELLQYNTTVFADGAKGSGRGGEVWPNHYFLKKEMFLAEYCLGQNPNLFWKSLWLAPLIVTKCTFFGAKLQNFSRLIFAQFIIGAIMVQVFIFYILYFLVLASPRSGINFTERCSQGWLSQWACTLHAYNSK